MRLGLLIEKDTRSVAFGGARWFKGTLAIGLGILWRHRLSNLGRGIFAVYWIGFSRTSTSFK